MIKLKKRQVFPVQAMKVQFHSFLTFALDGDEWSASRRGRFTPGDKGTGQIYSEILKPCSPVIVWRRFEATHRTFFHL